jgi:hypothetical protein
VSDKFHPKKVQPDFSKLRKGAKVRLADGRTLALAGLYLSATGPVFMVKESPTHPTSQNVEVELISEIVED